MEIIKFGSQIEGSAIGKTQVPQPTQLPSNRGAMRRDGHMCGRATSSWKQYDGRAGIEPQIAEFKNDWSICAMSTDTFCGNAAMLLLKLLTHNMLQ